MPKSFIRCLYVLGAVLLAGCATPTPYAPSHSSDMGGYYHRKIKTDMYVIGFSGNGFSEKPVVYDYAVLRAAELGQELGFKYFLIEASADKTTHEEGETDMPDTFHVTSTGSTVRGMIHDNDIEYFISKPGIELGIRYGMKPFPTIEGKSIGISQAIQDLRNKHNMGISGTSYAQ